MLADKDAVATVAVKDLKAAKKFYGDTLGLKSVPVPEPEVLNYKSGNSTVLVYKSQFAGSNKATSVTWIVDDVEATVKDQGQGRRLRALRFSRDD